MAEPLFRERDGESAEVSHIELFFDLVFVFAITQVSHFLLDHPTVLGAFEAALLLLAVWSPWGDVVYMTNVLNPNRQSVRGALLTLMIAGLVMSSALPEAFGEKGMAFALAFVAFQLGRAVYLYVATRGRDGVFRHVRRALVWCVVYSALWIAGAFLQGEMRLALWVLALLVDFASTAFGYPVPGLGRTVVRDTDIEAGHATERVSLFILIALGESILVAGAEFAEMPWSAEVIAAMLSAVVQSMAMWWIYFYWTAGVAGRSPAGPSHRDDSSVAPSATRRGLLWPESSPPPLATTSCCATHSATRTLRLPGY
ncbi:MAG: low temperature requirement protein A [Devosia sp.]